MIKKLILLVCFSVLTGAAFAQNWGGGVDDEDWSWGFNFQYISAEYKILKNNNWRDIYIDPLDGLPITSKPIAISSTPSQGFGLGFVMNRRVTGNLDVRSTPSLIFSDRMVRYDYEEAKTVDLGSGVTRTYPASIDKKIQATMFEFPLGLKLKSDRLNNFRAYLLGGAKYSIDIASKKKTFDEGETAINKLLKSKRNYLSYEAGIGFDFYFEYFKMSPEIKLSYSPSDLLLHNGTAFSNPIDQLRLRQLTFSLIFQ